jgi:hypothetical protein
VRELLSAANQAARKRTLSETYGGGGWEMNFETQKRLFDWECVMGVNFVNQHLSYYSLNGVRKFDYPPSFSYHEPWWEHYRLMGDYIGRICMATSSGEQINRILLLQPNTTAWMYFSRKVKNFQIDSIRTGFKNLVYRFEQLQVEYDLGSENVMKTIGSVQGNTLRVGKRDYSLVIIPAEMENLDQRTFDLLSGYLENGGKILSFNQNISRLDGSESTRISELAARYPEQWNTANDPEEPGIREMLSQSDFTLTDRTKNGMLYHQRRILKDGQLLFLVNAHPSQPARATITLRGKQVTRFNPVNGEITSYPSVSKDGLTTFDVETTPAGSALFAVTDETLTGNLKMCWC